MRSPVPRVFGLTEKGIDQATAVLDAMPRGDSNKVIEALSGLKIQYSGVPLRALLRDVYARYRDWTHESEIADLL